MRGTVFTYIYIRACGNILLCLTVEDYAAAKQSEVKCLTTDWPTDDYLALGFAFEEEILTDTNNDDASSAGVSDIAARRSTKYENKDRKRGGR